MTLKITNDVFLKYITKDCQTLLKKKKVAPVEIKVGNFLHTAEFEDFFIFILFFFLRTFLTWRQLSMKI